MHISKFGICQSISAAAAFPDRCPYRIPIAAPTVFPSLLASFPTPPPTIPRRLPHRISPDAKSRARPPSRGRSLLSHLPPYIPFTAAADHLRLQPRLKLRKALHIPLRNNLRPGDGGSTTAWAPALTWLRPPSSRAIFPSRDNGLSVIPANLPDQLQFTDFTSWLDSV